MNTHADVALIVWNADVIELLSFVLRNHDLDCVGLEPSQGVDTIERLIATVSPPVVVVDLDPPYKRSAVVAQRLLYRFHNSSFVITCADPVLAVRSAPFLERYPLFQKPYDLNEIASTIQSLASSSLLYAAAMSR